MGGGVSSQKSKILQQSIEQEHHHHHPHNYYHYRFDEMEQSLTCRSTHSLIEEFTAEGDLNALEEVWLESVEEYKSKLGPHHYRTREAMNALAAIHIQQDHPEKAERLYLEVLKSSRDALGSKHVESIRAYYNLGETMLKTKKFHQANVWLLSCFLSQQDLLGIHHPDTLLTLRYLISSQAGCGKYIEAERLLKSTLDKLFLSLEANPVHIIDFSYLLCDIYYAVGRFEEAIALCQDCIEMSKEGEGNIVIIPRNPRQHNNSTTPQQCDTIMKRNDDDKLEVLAIKKS
eukprot:scaffold602_cov179-Ochromonas_danica.AAC.12